MTYNPQGEWGKVVKPIVDICELAGKLEQQAVFKKEAATALAGVLKRMAALLDDEEIT